MDNKVYTAIIEPSVGSRTDHAWVCLHTAIQDFTLKYMPRRATIKELYPMAEGVFRIVYTLNGDVVKKETNSVLQHDV